MEIHVIVIIIFIIIKQNTSDSESKKQEIFEKATSLAEEDECKREWQTQSASQ